MRYFLTLCLMALIATLSTLTVAIAAEGESLEYAVKAAYLYKFSPFVEWPSAAFATPTSAFGLCVVGEDPFGSLLDQVVAGQHVGNRPILVRRMMAAPAPGMCQIMYVSGASAALAGLALNAVRGTPVLTVTDMPASEGPRGVINLIVADNRVRFDIDEAAARVNGLAISSKLLSLAVNVRP